jgi:hypothetical protein
MLNLTAGSRESMELRFPSEALNPAGLLRTDEGECPFVNRSDSRCAEHLTMGGMGYAYDHCFGSFRSCSMYQELMQERRSRALVAAPIDTAVRSAEATAGPQPLPEGTWHRLRSRLVELTVGRRRLDRAA